MQNRKVSPLFETVKQNRFLTNLLIKITGQHPSAGRKKIRGGAVACGLAVRIFLIFSFFLIKQKEQKDQWYAEKMKTEVQIGTDLGHNWK
jgi:hypothetical protein